MYALDEMRGVERPSSECFRTNSFDLPIKKDRKKQYKIKSGERLRVNMTSDTFLADADPWRDEMWDIIRTRSDVVFWLLTKRPERVIDHLPADWGDGWENVVIAVTCENQDMFNKRLPYLLNIPAKHKELCLAPLLTDIDIEPALQSGSIEAICVGGENYANPRPCRYEWVQHIAETCYKYRINFCWYETGTNFICNNVLYHINNKVDQSRIAYFFDLNRRYYDIEYKLVHSDGSLVLPEEMHQKMYNTTRCLYCSNQDTCNGCGNCGYCKNITLVDRETFKNMQKAPN